jgi:hypothetical protein
MSALNENFKKNSSGKIALLATNKQRYEHKIAQAKFNYSEYLKLCDMKNDECYKKIGELRDKVSKIQWITREIRMVHSFEEKYRLLDKIQNFNIDVGKSLVRELKEFIQYEKTSSAKSPSPSVLLEFNTKFEPLKIVILSKIKSLISKLEIKEQAITRNTQNIIRELTAQSQGEFTSLTSDLLTYLSKQEKFIDSCAEYELGWKDKIKAQIVQFMCRYFENRQDDILKKSANASLNMESFTSKFKQIIRVSLNL